MSGIGDRIRTRIADPDEDSIGARLRRRRWEQLVRRFPEIDQMRVLDLGGTVEHWQLAPVRPASLVVVNIYGQETADSHVRTVVGDACRLPDELRDEHFDLVYSNSVIEHVGGHLRRVDMAEEARTHGDHHWIQTPYRYFPVEPHWLFPGFQFLPVSARAWLSSWWPLGWSRPRGRAALGNVLETELVSGAEMAYLFPDSDIVHEKVLGLTKSLIAVR